MLYSAGTKFMSYMVHTLYVHMLYIAGTICSYYTRCRHHLHMLYGAGSICLRYWLDIFICYTVQVVYMMTQYTRLAPSLSSTPVLYHCPLPLSSTPVLHPCPPPLSSTLFLTPVPHLRFSSPVNRIQMHYALITYCRSAVDPMINIDYVPSLLVYRICIYNKLVQYKFAVPLIVIHRMLQLT